MLNFMFSDWLINLLGWSLEFSRVYQRTLKFKTLNIFLFAGDDLSNSYRKVRRWKKLQ